MIKQQRLLLYRQIEQDCQQATTRKQRYALIAQGLTMAEEHRDTDYYNFFLAEQSCYSGNLFEQLDYLNKALAINQQDALLHRCKGACLNNLKRPDEALESFALALKQDSEDPAIWKDMGTTYANLERWYEAAKSFSKALDINPNDAEALAELSYCKTKLQHGSQQTPEPPLTPKQAFARLEQAVKADLSLDKAISELNHAFANFKKVWQQQNGGN